MAKMYIPSNKTTSPTGTIFENQIILVIDIKIFPNEAIPW